MRWAAAATISLAFGGISLATPAGEPPTGVTATPLASPASGTSLEAANAACITCHRDEASAWDASLHRASFTDRSFVRGYAIEPGAFCRDCHAPETRNGASAPWAESHGVTCTSCHGQPEAGERHPPRPRLNASLSCGACHEFSFEGAAQPPERSRLMQLTLTEHASSAEADRSCASCHMPRGSHRFDVSRNRGVLRAALAVTIAPERAPVTGERERTIVVGLRPRGVGHAFPTGDMFRRLVVRAEVLGDGGERVILRREQSFGRTFSVGGSVKRTLTDNRLTGPAEARLALGRLGRTHEVRIRVTYQRRLTVRPSLDPDQGGTNDGRLEAETVLYEETLPATDHRVEREVADFHSSQ